MPLPAAVGRAVTTATGRLRPRLLRANRGLGRFTGFKIAPAPLPGSRAAELRRLIDAFAITQALDVGAHRGGFADELRHSIRYRGDIVSFEPAEPALGALRERAAADPRWRVVPTAVGAVDGTAELFAFRAEEMNSLRPLSDHAQVYAPGLAPDGVQVVTVARLDGLWRDLDHPPDVTLLKIDTQGSDLDVIDGAGALVERIPAITMEVPVQPLYDGTPALPPTLAELERRGFELTGAFPIHRYAGGVRVIEFDCTFVNLRRL